jgi:hypothetical protein
MQPIVKPKIIVPTRLSRTGKGEFWFTRTKLSILVDVLLLFSLFVKFVTISADERL